MGNTVCGAAIKLLTLVPFLVAIYYFDLPRFSSFLASSQQLAMLVVASSLLILGAGLKWRILKVRLELSTVSFSWGLLLLTVAAALYVYGSYSADIAWFHLESFYILVLGYVAFRIGAGVLRSMMPLLVIFGFSFAPIPPMGSSVGLLTVILLFAEFLLCFLLYAEGRLRAMAVPVAVVLLWLPTWFYPRSVPMGQRLSAVVLILLPLLTMAIPGVRRFMLLPREYSPACLNHRVLPSGFCSICGAKVRQAKVSENFGFWGLLAVAIVTLLLLFASVPALAVRGGVPQEVRYSAQGFSSELMPAAPAGWQINSTTVLSGGTQMYSIVRVYVPAYHPETKNYTLYYDLAVGKLLLTVPAGYFVAGWNRLSGNSTPFGPFQGSLVTYFSPSAVMLVYSGQTTMWFLNGSALERCSVGVGFVRQFTNRNITADTNQFLSDIRFLWLPGFISDASYSSWSSFLSAWEADLHAATAFSVAAISLAAIGWVTYRAMLADERLDRFLTLASSRSGKSWTYLSRLLQMPHRVGTARDLASTGETPAVLEAVTIDSSMRELELSRLVVPVLVERGADIVWAWKAAV